MHDTWVQLVDVLLQLVAALSVAYTARQLRLLRNELREEATSLADRLRKNDK